jgi:thiol-disulfide isomerase/thioredoxin
MDSFSAETVTGDTFTDAELTSYDLTMVNVWTTWCSYCIMEMPDLQEVYDNLPENVNMISVCADGDSESSFALDILEENGCTFSALIPDENLEASLLSLIYSYPTTVFVDQNGNLVGDMQIGIPQIGDSAADAYLSLIDERLDQLN